MLDRIAKNIFAKNERLPLQLSDADASHLNNCFKCQHESWLAGPPAPVPLVRRGL